MPELKVVEGGRKTAMEQLVEDYFASKRAAGLSPNTLAAYRFPLYGVFLPFAKEEGVTKPEEVTQRLLDRLSTRLLEQGGARGQLSKFSVNTYLRTVNHFLNWARKDGGATTTAKAQTPRLPKHLVDVLSREEIQKLEDAAVTERDKLIIRLMADTGIRLGELLGLKTSGLVQDKRAYSIRVIGKGSKERLVPISPAMHLRLRRFVERNRPKDVLSERIFIGLRRRPGADYAALTKSGVEQMLRNLGRKLGMTKRVYPHVLRHSFVTWSLRGGMSPIMAAKIVGHSSLEMINQVYQHLNQDDANDAMMKLLREEE